MRNANTFNCIINISRNALDVTAPTTPPPAAKLRKFVVAYNWSQYCRYLRDNQLRDRLDAVYVADIQKLLSTELKQEQIVVLSNAQQRKDYPYIIEFLNSRVR